MRIWSTLTVGLGIAVLAAAGARAAAADGACLDVITFGDSQSEQAHKLTAERSEVVRGGLEEPARRLLPLEPKPQCDGGKLTFTMKCDPETQNYFTVRLWGSDHGSELGRLILFCNGKQVGYRHQGDIDVLNIADDDPPFPGRFFSMTLPLPLTMTQGQQTVALEIRSTGRIWPYGENYEQYQKVLKQPTRGIYRGYTHTNAYFIPPPGEKQGEPPANPPPRPAPGEEVLEKVKARVNRSLDGLLKPQKIRDLLELTLLAKAYHAAWTNAYHKDAVVQKAIESIDDLTRQHNQNKDVVAKVPKWRSFGPAGCAVALLTPQLKDVLDQPIDHDGDAATPPMARREAWATLLRASVDYRRTHRPIYTNQAMISDLNLYLSNRGLAALDPARALPEEQARRYLYEAVGIQPWLGNDTATGSEKPAGESHYLVTSKGLTKELGYVGSYGEILDWVAKLYDATCGIGTPGDGKIKAQLLKLARARSYFRYPSVDGDGCRAMVLESPIGWRDTYYPGPVVYGARTGWESTATCTAAILKDPLTVGFAQQMLADNQFFKGVDEVLSNGTPDASITLLGVPDEYATIKALCQGQVPLPAREGSGTGSQQQTGGAGAGQAAHGTPPRLPMCDGQPDFAWADEEDGVLALKHGDERLYVSLYWRAYFAINNWARAHYITPRMDRIATVREETEFVPSGKEYTLPDWVDKGMTKGFTPPGDIHQAFAGVKQPIAAAPAGYKRAPGQGDPYAGRASFYTCRYGKYLIGMNCSKDKTYELKAPDGMKQAAELISGRTIELNAPVKVTPMSTVVLYLE